MHFYDGPREETSPFFMARDRKRPYTYSAATADLRRMLRKVSGDVEYGLHGLRVQGYNDACAGASEQLAVAHGGWKSTAHTRYARFSMTSVVNLSSAMLSAAGFESADKSRDEVIDGGDVSDGDSEVDSAEGAEECSEGSGAGAAAESGAIGGQSDAVRDEESAVDERPASTVMAFLSSPVSSIAHRLSRRGAHRN
jgi:hypothetical protein